VRDGQPEVFVSFSLKHAAKVAEPIAEGLNAYGLCPILVSKEPLPEGIDSNPDAKVQYFINRSQMAVFLATPDDRTRSGEVHTRQNIIDEHRMAKERPHLRDKLLVFKHERVQLPSNINPVYEPLVLGEPAAAVARIVEQARAWGLLPTEPSDRNESPQSPTSSKSRRVASGVGELGPATSQSLAAVAAVASSLAGSRPASDDLDRAQLALASLQPVWMADEALGVHVTNRLYLHRHDLELSPTERRRLVEQHLREKDADNTPGLYWLDELSRAEAHRLLEAIAAAPTGAAARANALRMLQRGGWKPVTKGEKDLLRQLLATTSQVVRQAALEYVAGRPKAGLLPLLEDPGLAARESAKVAETRAVVLASHDPSAAVDLFSSDPAARYPRTRAALQAAARRMKAADLERLREHPDYRVRRFAITLAARRGGLGVRAARAMVANDDSLEVRTAALGQLVEREEPLSVEKIENALASRDTDVDKHISTSDQRQVRLKAYSRMPAAQMDASLDWSGVGVPERYESLAVQDPERMKRVRADLTDGFTAYQTAAHERLIAETAAAAAARMKTQLPPPQLRQVVNDQLQDHWSKMTAEKGIGGFIAAQLTAAALRALLRAGVPRDVHFGRQYITHPNTAVRIEAVRLIGRWGTAADAQRLLIAAQSGGPATELEEIAEIAFRLTRPARKLDFLGSVREQSQLATWSVRKLADISGKQAFREVLELLDHRDAPIRRVAAEVVFEKVDLAKFADLFNQHALTDTYYYNVMCALDRKLYTPAWLSPSP
jgi:hypothetical protein